MGNGSIFGTDSGVGSTIALLEAQLPAVRERRSRAEAELAAVTAEEEAITKALDGLRLLSGTPLDPGVPSTEVTAAPSEAVPDAGTAAAEPAEPIEEQAVPSPEEPAAAAPGARKRTAARKAPAQRVATAKKTAPAAVRGTRVPASGAKKAAGKAAADTEPKAAAKRVPAARKAAAQRDAASGKPPVDASAPQTGRRRRVADANDVLELLSQAGGPLRAREVAERLGLDAVEGNVNAIRSTLERLAKDSRAQRTGRGLYTAAAGRPGAGS
ncbi:hypothetical protein [Kitasatospora aburaviensis]|uniref:Prephenate dehydrogenase n=1 Tax=Kitasatospora aburaviensis TaxID=67265 RepID=A0ABW1F0N8_9ACTN